MREKERREDKKMKEREKKKAEKKRRINEISVEGIKIDEIHTRYVKKMGHGAIIYFFKEHIGKKVYVIIPKEKEKSEKRDKSKRKK